MKARMDSPYQARRPATRHWLADESGYGEQEWADLTMLRIARQKANLHHPVPALFDADNDQAIQTLDAGSWLWPASQRPRQAISREQFHIRPIDGQLLQWPSLTKLMRQIGDYLLLRNQHQPEAHLNDPMNFAFLDIVDILQSLSQTSDIKHVTDQLEKLTAYLRTLEISLSTRDGSDKLVLAHLRQAMEDQIYQDFKPRIISDVLRVRLARLLRHLDQLESERTAIAHFALADQAVNAHPYDFEGMTDQTNPDRFPAHRLLSLLAKGQSIEDVESRPVAHTEYLQTIKDIHALDQFQGMVKQLLELLDQAGEIFTIAQFKEQLVQFLLEIDHFIDQSFGAVKAVLDAEDSVYQAAIYQKEKLPWWKRWLSGDLSRLNTLISNHDNLGHFPCTAHQLQQTQQKLSEEAAQIISYLNTAPARESNLLQLQDRMQQINGFLTTMQQITASHQSARGVVTARPVVLSLPATQENGRLEPIEQAAAITTSTTNSHCFFPTAQPVPGLATCPAGDPNCHATASPVATGDNSMMLLGLATLLPLGLFFLILLWKWRQPTEVEVISIRPLAELRNAYQQLLDEIKKLNAQPADEDLAQRITTIEDRYSEINDDAAVLQGLVDELEYLVDYYFEEFNLGVS